MASTYDMRMTGIWKCLTCRWYSEGKPTLVDPNDLTPMPLTSGQREEVFCPRCNIPRTSEFAPHSRGVLSAQQGQVTGSAPVQAQVAPPVAGTVVGKDAAPLPPGAAVAVAGAVVGHVPHGAVPAHAVAVGSVPHSPTTTQMPFRVPTPAEIRALPTDGLGELSRDLKAAHEAVEARASAAGICGGCYGKPANCIFYPCKCRVRCADCGAREAVCPKCGATVNDRIHT